MHRVEPKVFLVAESKLLSGAQDYMDHLGTKWTPSAPVASDPEVLVEMMGRLCYRSWEPGMNANVTKVREGNAEYLANILKSGHGSVLEHATMSFIFADVSRVFTHELVRHRAGMAFSQESLRFVRLTDLGLWLPPQFEEDPTIKDLFESTFRNLEELQLKMAAIFDLDNPTKKFKDKKVLTSAMRRAAPIGLATTIGATFNVRALRHVIEMRTSEGAEAEMRLVFGNVASIAKKRWPNLFQDMNKTDNGEWVFTNHKI
jgi:thymidylate synthase (FAD)